MKKKILFIIWSYTYGGGAEALLTMIVNHLNPQKYDISIIEYEHAEIKKEPVNDNIHVLPCIQAVENMEYDSKGAQLYHTPEVLIDAYIKKDYDLYISFNYQIPTFLLPKGTKNIAWIHGSVYDLAERRRLRDRKRQDLAFEKVKKIVVISDNTEKSVVDLFPGHKDKLVKIYNGVDIERVRKMAGEEAPLILERPALLFIGRLESGKDPVRLVNVLRLVHEKGIPAHLYFMGQGKEDSNILERGEKLNLSEFIHLIGYCQNPFPIVKQCDVVCLLSKAEGFSMCLLESVALDRPFVATPVGGAEELSNHRRCGRIIETDEEAAGAICELLGKEKEKTEAECQKSIERFALGRYISQIEDLFDTVMGEEEQDMVSERTEIRLREKYKEIEKMFRSPFPKSTREINTIVRKAICTFLERCQRPAIWCYGKHTKMLMADFMFELKKVHYIIDNGIQNREESGFEIIDENSITDKQIDGIIISSRIYKDEIAQTLKSKYENIPYLDIYKELEKAGIYLDDNYYAKGNIHPYSRYCSLNKMQRHIFQEGNGENCREEWEEIIKIYIEMKDFRSAIQYTEKMIGLFDGIWEKKLLEQLKDIYELQLDTLRKIDENNVIMLCIDGLRRKEVNESHMSKLYGFIKNNTYYLDNAYSVSTSTYESLIPAYSENDDLRTKYYEVNRVSGDGCRFINEAKRQNRNIYFYTDGTEYIEDAANVLIPKSQTASEKMWDFTMDAASEKNGLFYIHILYESHYSYPNPYTTEELVAAGTNIMFDYLGHNGGKIRTDYDRQQKDALRYLDDVIVPLIENLQCRMVLYADHGNILIDRETQIESVEAARYTFHEDLIQVPFAVKSPETGTGTDHALTSIMELNDVIIGLMNKRPIRLKKRDVIKVLRSEIYNPDFRYLYQKVNNGHGLLAFEAFLFAEGYKLAVYADGIVKLYLTETDAKIEDRQIKQRLLYKIKDKITVCAQEQIVI